MTIGSKIEVGTGPILVKTKVNFLPFLATTFLPCPIPIGTIPHVEIYANLSVLFQYDPSDLPLVS